MGCVAPVALRTYRNLNIAPILTGAPVWLSGHGASPDK